jgi:hydrogenase nickel incorporation protein HypA/HybF
VHELSLVSEILRIAEEGAGAARIRRIVVEVGTWAAVEPESLRFCFALATESTPAEGAVLDIVEVPARATCTRCQAEVVVQKAWDTCACGETNLAWHSGEELRVRALEVV